MRATGCNPCWYSPFADGPTPVSVRGVLLDILKWALQLECYISDKGVMGERPNTWKLTLTRHHKLGPPAGMLHFQ